MNRLLSHLTQFALMFALVFVFCAAIAFFIPAFVAFIAWDSSFMQYTLEGLFVGARIIAAISLFMGLMFAFSPQGIEGAKDMEKLLNAKKAK